MLKKFASGVLVARSPQRIYQYVSGLSCRAAFPSGASGQDWASLFEHPV